MSRADGPLRILHATPECAPWVKTGGLGDVSAALPGALARLGHDVKLLLPAYPALRPLLEAGRPLAEWSAHGPWPGGRLVHAGRHRGVDLLLHDCPALFDRPGGPYEDAQGDNARRFAAFAHLAARLATAGSPWPAWQPDLLHVHDWPAALAPAYLQRLPGPRAASVLTIHNLAFQGNFPLHLAHELELPGEWLHPEGIEFWHQVSFLKAGVQFADALTTVSPNYAREILGTAHGCGFDGILRRRAHRLVGILNGVDRELWNPATDPHLPARYDARALPRKAVNKRVLQDRLGLEQSGAPMLFGLVGRLTHQKGIDLVVAVTPWLVEQGAQLAVLGQGEPALEAALQALAERHRGRVAVRLGFDEPLAHLIEAGCDAFLMPSRFEPCGLNQLYSLAYGTVPIVRATGGWPTRCRRGTPASCSTTPSRPRCSRPWSGRWRPTGSRSPGGPCNRPVWGKTTAGRRAPLATPRSTAMCSLGAAPMLFAASVIRIYRRVRNAARAVRMTRT